MIWPLSDINGTGKAFFFLNPSRLVTLEGKRAFNIAYLVSYVKAITVSLV